MTSQMEPKIRKNGNKTQPKPAPSLATQLISMSNIKSEGITKRAKMTARIACSVLRLMGLLLRISQKTKDNSRYTKTGPRAQASAARYEKRFIVKGIISIIA